MIWNKSELQVDFLGEWIQHVFCGFRMHSLYIYRVCIQRYAHFIRISIIAIEMIANIYYLNRVNDPSPGKQKWCP